MKKTMIIFDFDGTIADSLHMGIKIYNERLASRFRCKPVEEEELDDLRDMNIYKLLKDHNIGFIKLPILLYKLKKIMSKQMGEIPVINGMKEAIERLVEMEIKIGILTSNNRKNVEAFLNHHNMNGYFQFIYSEKNVFGKDKAIAKMMKIEKLDKILYVGDETRDIDACKKVGVPIVSVGWGFNTPSNLKSHNPDYFIENPAELLEIAKNID